MDSEDHVTIISDFSAAKSSNIETNISEDSIMFIDEDAKDQISIEETRGIQIDHSAVHPIDQQTEENYSVWKKNSIFLYDYLSTTSLLWPSLSVSWFPDLETTSSKNMVNQRVLLGTFTSGQSQDYINVSQVPIHKPIVENINLNKFDLDKNEFVSYNSFPKVNQLQRIYHDCDINKTRYCPQKPDLIATINNFGTVNIFDRTKHPSNLSNNAINNNNKPDIQLNKHTKEGFGLSWNYQVEGQLISGSMDGSVILWDIKKYTKTENGISENTIYSDIDSMGVNDVKWLQKHDSIFGAVDENGSLGIYDTRSHKIVYENRLAHDNGINILSFNPSHMFTVATGDSKGGIKIWDMRNLKVPFSTIQAHSDSITSLEWNPQHAPILASSSADKFVHLWDVGLSEKVFVHGGHMLGVNDINWNPHDEWMLSSVGDDNSLHIWKPSSSITAQYSNK